jgi:hypothetical protein
MNTIYTVSLYYVDCNDFLKVMFLGASASKEEAISMAKMNETKGPNGEETCKMLIASELKDTYYVFPTQAYVVVE